MTARLSICTGLLLSLLLLTACSGGSSSSSSSDSSDPTSESLARLQGHYAFLVADRGCVCTFAAAGSFQADGKGDISSGVMDLNHDGSVQNNVAVKGTYTIDTNGRGSATLQSSDNTFTFHFVVLSSTQAFVIGFDTNQNASGTIDLQDPTAFSPSALAGSFAFRLSGTDVAGEAIQMGGVFTSDSTGAISSGIEDVHNNQVIETALPVQPTAMSVTAANGRGTLAMASSFANSSYALYVIDANHLELIGINPGTILFGDAYRQSTSPSAALKGTYAFTAFGWTSGVPLPLSAGGLFSGDGKGGITNGAEDENNDGSITENSPFTGQYTLADNGRGTLIWNSSSGTATFAIYTSQVGIQMVEIDSSGITGGMAFLQSASPFSTASLKGSFGLSTAGSSNGKISDELAVLSADGSGTLNGTMDLNNERSPEAGLPVNGTYSISNNGRGTASLNTSDGATNLILYMVNNSTALALSSDKTSVMVGSIE